MRRRCICFSVSLALLAGVALVIAGNFSSFTFAQSREQDEASIVQVGIDQARASLRSGKGSVKVLIWQRKSDGGELQIEREYSVAFKSDKFKIRVEDTYLKNESSQEQKNGYLIRPGDRVIKELVSDGSTATVYLVNENRAIVGDPKSGSVGAELHNHNLYVMNGSLGLPSLGATSNDISRVRDASPDEQIVCRVVGRETINGSEYIVREISRLSSNRSLIRREWVDPNRGFSVHRVRVWGETELLPERTLLSASDAEYKPWSQDGWAVSKIVSTEYRTDTGSTHAYKSSERTVIYADDFGYNVEVADSDLNLHLPSGTRVFNELLNLEYVVP